MIYDDIRTELVKLTSSPNLRSGQSFSDSYWKLPPNEQEALYKLIISSDILSDFHNRSFHYSNQSVIAAPNHLHSWLIKYSIAQGIDLTIAQLKRYVEGGIIGYNLIHLLSGVSVQEPIGLAPNVRILPVDKIPSIKFQNE